MVTTSSSNPVSSSRCRVKTWPEHSPRTISAVVNTSQPSMTCRPRRFLGNQRGTCGGARRGEKPCPSGTRSRSARPGSPSRCLRTCPRWPGGGSPAVEMNERRIRRGVSRPVVEETGGGTGAERLRVGRSACAIRGCCLRGRRRCRARTFDSEPTHVTMHPASSLRLGVCQQRLLRSCPGVSRNAWISMLARPRLPRGRAKLADPDR